VANLDRQISEKEAAYIEDTPHGNILSGFENYTKPGAAGVSGRRKAGFSDSLRVFSQSSVRPSDILGVESPAASSAAATPSAAPTPLSSNFGKGESTTATPSGAVRGDKGLVAGLKKGLKRAVQTAAVDDGDGDGKDSKRAKFVKA
jgi:chromatin modification-related protein EAF6